MKGVPLIKNQTMARRAARMLSNGISKVKVMSAMGAPDSVIYHNSYKIDKQPLVKKELEKIREAAERHDLTYDRLAKKVSVGLDAKRIIVVGEKAIESDKPDHDAQTKWWDKGAMMLGIQKQRESDGVGEVFGEMFKAMRARYESGE